MSAAGSLTACSTAEDALGDARLDGRVAIVTGANAGLGAETARVLAEAGARVIMACRSVATGEIVATVLRSELGDRAGTLEVGVLDLADLASVRQFAADFLDAGAPLHILVNNAGVMATPLDKTRDGHELQVGTNHLGHFLLTSLLRPALEAAERARIVNVSSSLHGRGRGEHLLETLERDPAFARRKYVPFDAYGDSKLANVLFTKSLADIFPRSVEAFAVHPGVIPTQLSRNMGVLGTIYRAVGRPFLKTVPQGAATSVFAATSSSLAGQSGAYLADCAIRSPSADARDASLATRLWQTSETLVARA